MTNQVLKLVNRKTDFYRDWKSTSDNNEYERKKLNNNNYDRIVNKSKESRKIYITFILLLTRKII